MPNNQVTINSQTMRAVYGNCGTTTCNPCSQSMIYPYPTTSNAQTSSGVTGPYPYPTTTSNAQTSSGVTGPYPYPTATAGSNGPPS